MSYLSDFLKESQARGFIHQGTDLEGLDAAMQEKSIVAYIGFDATADSLHVGSLLQIMWLRLLQKHGHKPIVLMGDGTTRIGDPSWKDTARPLLDEQTIEDNIQGIEKIFKNFLSFGKGSSDASMLRNYAWLKDLKYLEFLRDYGRYFSVNRMLTFDSVRLRLEREQPLSFLEFNYMILQGYDFLELYRQHKCVLQLGGSDQWSNILNGTDLIRRVEGKEAFGLTAPLITTSEGGKMGKTTQGAVWLNGDKLSPFEYWQFWRNTQDPDVPRFLRIFTDLDLGEIERLEKLQGAEINDAKKILANETTRLCHGEKALDEVLKTVGGLFSGAEGGLSAEAALVTVDLKGAELEQGVAAVDLFVSTQLATSKGEARRLIRGGGARVNDQKIEDEDHKVTLSDLNEKGLIKLSAGRKHHALVRVERVKK